MANYATLKAAIQEVIRQNGNNEITGSLLQQTLLAMINALGGYYQFADIATPSTNPGTPDQRVFYITTEAGAYPNFDGVVVDENEVAILCWDSAWHKLTTGMASAGKVTEIEDTLIDIIGSNDVVVNLSLIPSERGIITGADNHWYVPASGTSNMHMAIPVGFSKMIEVDSNTGTGFIAFLSSYQVPTNGELANIVGVRGEIERNKTNLLFPIPEGAKYVVFRSGDVYTPLRFVLKGVPGALNTLNDAVEALRDDVDALKETVDGVAETEREVLAFTERVSTYRTYANSLTPGKSYVLKVHSVGNYTRFGFTNVATVSAWSTDVENSIYASNQVGDFEIPFIATAHTYIAISLQNASSRIYVDEIIPGTNGLTNKFDTLEETVNSLNDDVDVLKETVNGIPDIETEVLAFTERVSTYRTYANSLTPGKSYVLKVHSVGNYTRFGFTNVATVSAWSTDVENSIYASNQVGDFEIPFIATAHTYIAISLQNVSSRMYVVDVTPGEKGLNDKILELNDRVEDVEQDIETLASRQSIHILHLGNSYSLDACAYVHKLMEQFVGRDVVIGIIYNAGASFVQYHDTLIPNNTCAAYYKYSNGQWTRSYSKTIDDVLANEKWDIVLMHQASNLANDYSTYQPYLNQNIDSMAAKLGYSVEFGLLLTTPRNGNDYGITYFNALSENQQESLEDSPCDFIIPCGTALQNLRSIAYFNEIGDDGGMMSETHLQTGIGQLVESYAYLGWIAKKFALPIKILGNTYRPVAGDALVTHGTGVQGITDANCRLAQIAAIKALQKPYLITDINNFIV